MQQSKVQSTMRLVETSHDLHAAGLKQSTHLLKGFGGMTPANVESHLRQILRQFNLRSLL